MITASKVHQAFQCSYRFRPDVPSEPRAPGKAALMGTEAHELLEELIRSKVPPDKVVLSSRDYERHALQAYAWVDRQGWPTHCEVGFIYNTKTDTAVLGPRRGEPGYDHCEPHEIRGTFDLVWIDGDHGRVVDYKTGSFDNAHVEQLACQAVAASRIWGLKTVEIGFLFSRLTKWVEKEFTKLSADDLDAEAGKLHGLLKRLPMAEAVDGDHCRWCDVVPGNCPIWTNKEE